MAQVTINELISITPTQATVLEAENPGVDFGKITIQQIVDLVPLDNYLPLSGGTLTGNLEIEGDLTVQGLFTSRGIDDNAIAKAFTIASVGAVTLNAAGIDTSAYLNSFQIQHSGTDLFQVTTGPIVTIAADNTFDSLYLYGGSTGDNSIRINGSGNLQSFHTNGNERMRIDSAGQITIADLAGTGTRNVQVQADGTLIAV